MFFFLKIINKMDYYKVLGINRNANISQIKKAYHRLALKYHPDKVKEVDKDKEDKFKKISEAYQVLSDPIKKGNYDLYGSIDLKNQFENPIDLFDNFFGKNNIYRFFNHSFTEPEFNLEDNLFIDKPFNNFFGNTYSYSSSSYNDNGKKDFKSVETKTVIRDGKKKTKTITKYTLPDGKIKTKITYNDNNKLIN